jgi:hypothetical protein
MLGRLTRMAGQFLQAHLTRHLVADPHHGVFDIVDILRSVLDPFLLSFGGQQLCHQRFHTFLDPLVSCHPWLLCLK